MPINPTTPGVYTEQLSNSTQAITGVETSVTAFVGRTTKGIVNDPTPIESFADFEHNFGGLDADLPLTYAVRDFFQNGGTKGLIVRLTKSGGNDTDTLDVTTYLGSEGEKTGIYALLKADIFNLLCIPPDTQGADLPAVVYQAALSLCVQRKAFLIVDSPAEWTGDPATATAKALASFDGLGLTGPDGRNGAIYFPRVKEFDPLRNGELGTFASCGIIAGIIAWTDEEEGVWKAPAGISAAMNGVAGLDVVLNDDETGELNPAAINCLRNFTGIGNVVWGARTLRGSDQLEDDYKYIPVRRLALYIEESLKQGLQWTQFEPNDEVLWSAIRLSAGNFMQGLYIQGAFFGNGANDAYFVQCDSSTTTQTDIDQGIVNIIIGFAPVKPAEFIVIEIQCIAAVSG